jgi:hypothetical protein
MMVVQCADMKARIADLEAEVERLRHGVREYGTHRFICAKLKAKNYDMGICDCGFDALTETPATGGETT